MLFDWSTTTIVVAFCGRNEIGCGFRFAARHTANAASATSAAPRTIRMIVLRRSGNASPGASPSGIPARRRLGSLAASSDAVTVCPPLEVLAHLGRQRRRPVALGVLLRPCEFLRLAGEAAATAGPQLLGEQLERLPPLVGLRTGLLDRDQRALERRE